MRRQLRNNRRPGVGIWAQPAGVAGNSWPPSSPPTGSRAAATCMSAWVSKPPVMALVSVRWSLSSLLRLTDGTHRWQPGPVNPGLLPPLARARQIRPSAAPTNWRSLASVMSQPPMTFLTAWRPDRARLENCRAPDTRRSKHGLEIRSFGAQLVAAADRYKAGPDRRSFDERFGQLEPLFHGQRRDVISVLCGRCEAPVVRPGYAQNAIFCASCHAQLIQESPRRTSHIGGMGAAG